MLNQNTERLPESPKWVPHTLLEGISSSCTDCGLCLNQCEFLKRFGSPKRIADNFNPEDPATVLLSFSCSLCGLCTAVCPEKLDPVPLMREMRCTAFENGYGDFPEHRRLLRYEARGCSSRYSWYGLPEGCDSVFFPGCTLPGTRPRQTLSTFEKLQNRIPALGIVLDCCAKPSHDLGRQAAFLDGFGSLKMLLLSSDIKTVVAACPNCYQVIKNYGAPLQAVSVYEVLAELDYPNPSLYKHTVSIHDSCAVRFNTTIHVSVRRLLEKVGMRLVETRNSGPLTLCCGEGGGAGHLQPDLAKQWARIRREQSGGRHLLTYCAGCAGMLSKVTSVSHVLDYVHTSDTFGPFKRKVYRPPMTYFNRLRLKRFLMGSLKAKHSGTRPYPRDAR